MQIPSHSSSRPSMSKPRLDATPSNSDIVQVAIQEKALDEIGGVNATDQKDLGWYSKIFYNRWVQLFTFSLALFLTADIYYGWQQYQEILAKGGAYAWLCPDDWDFTDDNFCDEQTSKIGMLYSVAAGCEYASALLAGIFLDHLGPKESGAIGETLLLIGHLLLMFSSESFQAYIPAFVCIGSACNIIAFPALVLSDIFPGYNAMAAGIILGAQNLCTAVSPTMLSLWNHHPDWTFKSVEIGYLLSCWMPATILYLLTLPAQRSFKKQLAEVKKVEQELEGPENQALREKNEDAAKRASWSTAFHYMVQPNYIVLIIFYMIQMLQNSYYTTNVRPALGDNISDYVGYFMPTQAVWALLGGFVIEVLGTAASMVGFATIVGICMVLSTWPSVTWLQYLSSTTMVIQNSGIYAIKYSYSSEMYDKYHYGKLTGMVGLFGGCFTFVNIPVSASGTYTMWYWIFAGVCIPLVFVALWLLYIQRRGLTYKADPTDTRVPWSIKTHNPEIAKIYQDEKMKHDFNGGVDPQDAELSDLKDLKDLNPNDESRTSSSP